MSSSSASYLLSTAESDRLPALATGAQQEFLFREFQGKRTCVGVRTRTSRMECPPQSASSNFEDIERHQRQLWVAEHVELVVRLERQGRRRGGSNWGYNHRNSLAVLFGLGRAGQP